jgi:hypothetical protein
MVILFDARQAFVFEEGDGSAHDFGRAGVGIVTI